MFQTGSHITLNPLLALKLYKSMAYSLRLSLEHPLFSFASLSDTPFKEQVCEGALQVYSVVSSSIL